MLPEIEGLRLLALSATPGPWDSVATIVDAPSECTVANCNTEGTAAFIAAAGPDVVLSLLDRLEAAEAAVERVRGLHERQHSAFLNGDWCSCCGQDWPCDTIRALSASGVTETKDGVGA